MFGLNRPKFDLQEFLNQVEHTMSAQLEESLRVQGGEIRCVIHKQGVDIIFSFVKKELSPIRKKISYLMRTEKALKRPETEVYNEIFQSLKRLGELRLNEMTV